MKNTRSKQIKELKHHLKEIFLPAQNIEKKPSVLAQIQNYQKQIDETKKISPQRKTRAKDWER